MWLSVHEAMHSFPSTHTILTIKNTRNNVLPGRTAKLAGWYDHLFITRRIILVNFLSTWYINTTHDIENRLSRPSENKEENMLILI
jgi:hypothetical protein